MTALIRAVKADADETRNYIINNQKSEFNGRFNESQSRD